MKGQNEIVLNQQTVVEALQHYFSTVVFAEGKCPVVKSVETRPPDSNRSSYSPAGPIPEFIVKVSEKEA